MKNIILSITLILFFLNISAQEISISFQANTDGTKIDSTLVTNTKTNQVETLYGNESLLLVAKNNTGLTMLTQLKNADLVYPNPCNRETTICFSTDETQYIAIVVSDIHGKIIANTNKNLTSGGHRFKLQLPHSGVFIVSISNNTNWQKNFKLVNNGKNSNACRIDYEGKTTEKFSFRQAYLKNASTVKELTYTKGDIMLYKSYSGTKTTISTGSPEETTNYKVDFYECKDKDNKSYNTVKIGAQIWMAENLAYLPAVSSPTQFSGTEPVFYVYGYMGNNVAEAKATAEFQTYGVLYNWTAAMNSCPEGWHLPSKEEWEKLSDFLGGFSESGKKMKVINTIYGQDEQANNSSGFSALMGGLKTYISPTFHNMGSNGYWWTSTTYPSNNEGAWMKILQKRYTSLDEDVPFKKDGYSVRCIKD